MKIVCHWSVKLIKCLADKITQCCMIDSSSAYQLLCMVINMQYLLHGTWWQYSRGRLNNHLSWNWEDVPCNSMLRMFVAFLFWYFPLLCQLVMLVSYLSCQVFSPLRIQLNRFITSSCSLIQNQTTRILGIFIKIKS